jgi:predicted nicotinamide N-methyase
VTIPVIECTREVKITIAGIPFAKRMILHKGNLNPRSEWHKIFPEGVWRMDVMSAQVMPIEAGGNPTDMTVLFIADVFYGHQVVDREASVPFIIRHGRGATFHYREGPSRVKV